MNLFTKLNITLLLSVFFLGGCVSSPNEKNSNNNLKPSNPPKVKNVSTLTVTKNKLDLFYNEWKGTRYRFGGTSKSGVDCSAFIQILMTQVFDMSVPRTTTSQTAKGSKISKNSAKFGDLVFFKTGRNSRHVGLYLGDGTFMHASTSRGVMISSVDNVYWKKHFWHYRTYSDV